jgi:8-oxo-dGTP diphosphatase
VDNRPVLRLCKNKRRVSYLKSSVSVVNTFIHVAVAAIVNKKGEVLVSQRKPGTHLGGYWEFPGGKLEQGESVADGLCRELKEELGIVPLSTRPLIRTRHHYPEKSVLLDVWKVEAYSGSPAGVEGQRIEWRAVDNLDPGVFPPADVPIINALILPGRYLITGEFSSVADFEQRLSGAIRDGIELVQLRLTHDWVQANAQSYAFEIMELCTRLCKQNSVKLLYNVPVQLETLTSDGIHLNSGRLLKTKRRPAGDIVSASCHGRQELEHAQSIGVDFAVLSPVQKTRSHPHAQRLGWEAFRQLVDGVNIPVYALGGVTAEDIAQARRSGGQGVAAISAFWK